MRIHPRYARLFTGAGRELAERRDGSTLDQRTVVLVKRAPKTGCEWKIDRADKVILNNGKPFFAGGDGSAGDSLGRPLLRI